MHLCLCGDSPGRSLAAVQGNPVSQVKLWVPQSPGKVEEEEVVLQQGQKLIKERNIKEEANSCENYGRR